MNEKLENALEKKPEQIPTQEEVKLLFEKILETKEYEGEYETERLFEDEEGLYLWTIKITIDEDGGYAEYEYTRKGKYLESEEHGKINAPDTAIHVALSEKDGFPISGCLVTACINGKWEPFCQKWESAQTPDAQE